MTNKKKNDVGCKTVLQYPSPEKPHIETVLVPVSTKKTSTKVQVKKPQIRINGSKGHEYVQIKGVFVTTISEGWVTVGPATPRNLGFAARMAEEDLVGSLENQITNIGRKHGILKDKKDMEEFKMGNPNKQPFRNEWSENPQQDAAEEEYDKLRKDMLARDSKAFDNRRKRDEKAVRKMMSKLRVKRRVLVQQKGLTMKDAEHIAAKTGKKITGETDGPEGKYWVLE
jgi:hypothetical protein